MITGSLSAQSQLHVCVHVHVHVHIRVHEYTCRKGTRTLSFYCGHHWDRSKCPDYRGVLIIVVSSFTTFGKEVS